MIEFDVILCTFIYLDLNIDKKESFYLWLKMYHSKY